MEQERIYYHHAENFNDYIQAVEEYKKSFPSKSDVLKYTPDPAVREMLLHEVADILIEDLCRAVPGKHKTLHAFAPKERIRSLSRGI